MNKERIKELNFVTPGIEPVLEFYVDKISIAEEKRIANQWKGSVMALANFVDEQDREKIFDFVKPVRRKKKFPKKEPLTQGLSKNPEVQDDGCSNCDPEPETKEMQFNLETLKEDVLKLPESEQNKVIGKLIEKYDLDIHPRVKKNETKLDKIIELIKETAE
jgi:hypothetical protein